MRPFRLPALVAAMIYVMALGAQAAQAAPAPAPAGLASVQIDDVPHVLQKPDFCGEACTAMWLGHLKKKGDQDYVFNLSGVDPAQGRGAYTAELDKALRAIGFKVGAVWYAVDTGSADQMDAQFAALHADLVKGVPSIVCMHYADNPAGNAPEHFRLVLGYDAKTDEVIYHEPAVARAAYQRMSRATFEKLWPLPAATRGKATLIRLRLEAGTIKEQADAAAPAANVPANVQAGAAANAAPPAVTHFTNADFAQQVMKVKKMLPEGDEGKRFGIAVSPPFVIVDDEGATAAKRWGEGTVHWTVQRLRAQYFAKDPDDLITIWLFKDKPSYEKNVKAIFGDAPDTPFGYYSPANKALVMNISTGGGTLVHEIVHPYVRANFPACPAWFNEGLGSLYEQSAERDGKIVGLTNWRLEGLQAAIKANSVPSFEKLTGTSDADFYGKDRGTNYAQARYLCYYLQEQGLLQQYFKDFVKNQKDDPTGYRTLVATLKEKDMDAFKERWERWVTGLKFP